LLTAEALLRFTQTYNARLFNNAKGVSVRFATCRLRTDKDGDEYREVKVVCVGKTVPRQVELHLYGPRNKNARVWATCTCPYWLYHCEVATERKDSTDIIHSNGARPIVKNPRMIPAVCKHIIQALASGACTLAPKEDEKSKRRSKAEPMVRQRGANKKDIPGLKPFVRRPKRMSDK
jgi:hypothetical protein